MTEADRSALALNLVGVSKSFGATKALRDVSLGIVPGEVHALVGQNGSGKSTMIKVLSGYHVPDAVVSAYSGGQPLGLGDTAEARRAGIHFVHQDLGLVENLDVLDNLALGRGYETQAGLRIRWRREARNAVALLDRLGHPMDVRRQVRTLTPIERTTVAIARALRDSGEDSGDDMRLLVLDEPTASMARPDVERLHQIVRRLTARGTAILYVSHHLDEVLSLADRVTIFRDGQSVGAQSTAGLTHDMLAELMTGHPLQLATMAEREASPGTAALQLKGLTGSTVTNLDLSVLFGEIVGVAGIDGSGREELGHLVFGSLRRSGTVLVDGAPLPANRPDISSSSGLGFVPANRATDGLVLSLTVRENLSLTSLKRYWRRWALSRSRERRDANNWITRLGVKTQSAETPVSALSGGNQQKVAVGKWLRMAPKVLILDEPTQGVDVAAKEDIYCLVDDVVSGGGAVLVCSTDEEELERLCDRVIVLGNGAVATEIPKSQISAARIARACLDARTQDHPGANS